MSARSAPAARAPVASTLLRATRPRHGIKNVLVLAAPAAAGQLSEGETLLKVAIAVAAFWLAAAGLYLVNDVVDAAEDRRHPRKASRPVASGALDARLALRVGALLIAAGLLIAASAGWPFLAVTALYVLVGLGYVFWARRVAILDVAAVACGFFLRAAGGAVVIDVPMSRWFAIVASFGSLFLVAGKRQGERMRDAHGAPAARATLDLYPLAYLREVVTVSAAVTIGAYCLWAFERADGGAGRLFELSIVPFVLFMLRYLLLIERGTAEEPERLVLSDPGLLAAAAAWCVTFMLAVTLE